MTLLIVLGMVVARVTRLWRDDTLTEGLRESVDAFLEARVERHRFRLFGWGWQKLRELAECPWCVSGWLSIAAVAIIDAAMSRSVEMPGLVWIAVWWISNLAYWLTELVADADAIAWDERKKRKID